MGFDVAQVENYKPDPKQLLNDARNRDGMRFEPLINSPGMYLMGPAPLPPNATTSGYPAVLEATQGWMSTMTYDAPGQLNFLYETRSNATDAYSKGRGSPMDHVEAQGEFAAAARPRARRGGGPPRAPRPPRPGGARSSTRGRRRPAAPA